MSGAVSKRTIDCYGPGVPVDEFELWRFRAKWNSAEAYKAERAGDHEAAARYGEAARIYRKHMANHRLGRSPLTARDL